MNKKCIMTLLVLILLSLLVGCGNSEFDSNYKQFKQSYMIGTSFVDEDNEFMKDLGKVEIDEMEIELKKMKEAMDKLNTNASTKLEKGICKNVKFYYEQVEFFIYIAKNANNLSIDEKQDFYIYRDIAVTTRKNINSGEE